MWKINIGTEGEKTAAYTMLPTKFKTKMEAYFMACRMAECDYLEALNSSVVMNQPFSSNIEDCAKVIFCDSECNEGTPYIKVLTNTKTVTYWIIKSE